MRLVRASLTLHVALVGAFKSIEHPSVRLMVIATSQRLEVTAAKRRARLRGEAR